MKPFKVRGIEFTADDVESLRWLTDTVKPRPDGTLTYLYQLRLRDGRTFVLPHREGYALEVKLKKSKKS